MRNATGSRPPIAAAASPRPPVRADRGVMLLIVVVVMSMAAALTMAMLSLSANEYNTVAAVQEARYANRIAEGAGEKGEKDVLNAISAFQTSISGAPVDVPLDGNTAQYAVSTWGTQRTEYDTLGVQTLLQYYQVTGTYTLNKSQGKSYRMIDVGRTPIFQYAVFYGRSDLEIFPGPAMTLSGRIHTNRDFYIGSNATLTLDTNSVKAAGNMYRQRKDNGTIPAGTLTVKKYGTATYPAWSGTNDSDTNPNFMNDATTIWGGTVKSGAHGVTDVASPDVPSVTPGGYYDTNAGLKIVDTTAYVGGVAVALPAGTITTKTFWDAREGRNVTCTVIDVGLLNTSGKFPPNGLLYARRTDTTSTQPNGIRLTNAATLSAGLTVVSPDPVYVKGNFNTVTKKPASIIADSVNLLSNAWNDTKTSTGLPTATATTYNFAMITGNTQTVAPAYNGGLENLPRFHENWSSVTCTIRGSFVNLWDSQYAKKKWPGTGGNFYNPPTRNWNYDTDFNTVTNLPPFTPMSVRTSKLVYWEWR